MHPKGADSMAASGLKIGCRKALVGTGWVISLLFCMNRLRSLPSVLVGPPFLKGRFFLSLHSHWPRAVTIENRAQHIIWEFLWK